jgi:GntR family transcriptional repressor for pyruvate dehydrogenase complex
LSDDTPPISLGVIARQPRLSDKVADDIVELILSNRLRPGDTLPPQSELGEQFGVSRTVIREAVRSLDAKGLVEVRSGSRIRIAAVDAGTASESLRHFVRGSAFAPGSIEEVRSALLVASAQLAAVRAEPEDLERVLAALDRAGQSAEDPAALRQAELDLFTALAGASGNELLVMLIDALGRALADARPSPPPHGPAPAATRGELGDALARRDPGAAAAAMRRYLGRAIGPGTEAPA